MMNFILRPKSLEIHQNQGHQSKSTSSVSRTSEVFKRCTLNTCDRDHSRPLKELLSHFQNLNMKKKYERNEPPNAARVFVPDFDREISVTKVEEVLPPRVFKALDNALAEMLAILFNNVMRSVEYPNCWSTGIICPIHKSGPRDDPNNYRGITLLNVMGKLFTAILCDRITQ